VPLPSPLLLRGAPDTAWILCRSFMPKHYRQLRVKDLSKIPTWQTERDSNPQPFRQKEVNLPMCPIYLGCISVTYYLGYKFPSIQLLLGKHCFHQSCFYLHYDLCC